MAVFKMVDIRPISFYLGLKVDKNCEKKIIKLFQPTYIKKVLAKYHFDKANTIYIPIKKVTIGQNLFIEATQAEKGRY